MSGVEIDRRTLLTRGTVLAGGLLASAYAPGALAADASGLVARQIPGFTADRREFYVAFIETVWRGTSGPRDPAVAFAAAETFEPIYDEWPVWLQRDTDRLFDDIQYGMKGRRFSDLTLKRRGDFLLSALRAGDWGDPSHDDGDRERQKSDWRRARAASRAAQSGAGKQPWYSGFDDDAEPTGGPEPARVGETETLGAKIVRAAALVTNGPGGAAPALNVED